MTSTPAPHPRRWSLRRRLLLSLVALFAVASLVVGVVSVLSLRGFLMDRLDEQLAAATGRSQSAIGGEPGDAPVPSPPPALSEFRPGVQGPFTVTAVVVGSRVLAVVVNEAGDLEQLSAGQARMLAAVPANGEAMTVSLGGTLGNYRASATPVTFGALGGVGTVVTGLPMSEVDAVLLRLGVVIFLVTAVALTAAVVAGAVVVRRTLRPLERVAATAAVVTELPLGRGEVALSVRVPEADADPSTEVGQVGAAINRMLEHVASALAARHVSENRVRRFVADASHELRTPLASIRGYAELTRMGGHTLPDDVVHAMGRVESEAKRMTSLVEDLLLLARLDEGRELERRPFDLGRLLVDAVSDAHAGAPDHEWSLRQPEGPVTVTGDASRLYQAVANLLANARVHTPPGTSVLVELDERQDRVTVTVTDDGPGFPPEMRETLFERFARGDGSRSRESGSTGLGLAIVRSVVTGHGGTVDAVSDPGRTRFTIELPR